MYDFIIYAVFKDYVQCLSQVWLTYSPIHQIGKKNFWLQGFIANFCFFSFQAGKLDNFLHSVPLYYGMPYFAVRSGLVCMCCQIVSTFTSCYFYFVYNLKALFPQIGSTEWVEENLEDLLSKAVAYLNVDCAVQGVGIFAGSTPQLDKLLVDVTRQVKAFFICAVVFFCFLSRS